jgi:hypothetical protein
VISVAFVRRINPDGSQTSCCQKCHSVVATTSAKMVLDAAENFHICHLSEFIDSLLPPYVTLTERVLMFLDGHWHFV